MGKRPIGGLQALLMALTLGKKNPRGSVGLDLDGAFVAAVQAQDGRISRAASMELPSGVITDGEVTDVERLTESLKTFFKENDLPTRVRLGVSNQQIVVRHLELPQIEEQSELAAAVRFQAAEAIAKPVEEAAEAAAPAGSLVPGVPALTGPLACVYCHLGGVTNLAVAVGTNCLFTRPLSTDWAEEGENVASPLAEEIRLSIDFYMAQPDARPVGEVQLSGPGSSIEGLAEQLSGLIHLPVAVADPLGGLVVNGALDGENPHRHTVAAGLALGAAA